MNLSAIDFDHYRQLRSLLTTHQNAAVKTVPRYAINKIAKLFHLLEGNSLSIESESELIIIFDFCIYSHLEKGKTVVQTYLAKLPPTHDPDEQIVRAAMTKSRFSMFEVERIMPRTGIEVRDLVRGDLLSVADNNLSQTVGKGQVLGGRLVPLPNYWATTGASFPLSKEAVQTVKKVFLPALRLTEGKLTDLRLEAEQELATVVIWAALEDGTASQIEYE